MADAGLWLVWGVPTPGREKQALETFKESMQYFGAMQDEARIERFDAAILTPQTSEMGGFVLLQGTQQQIDSLRRDDDFQRFVRHVQLVAERFAVVDAWVDQGLGEALGLYEDALRRAGLS